MAYRNITERRLAESMGLLFTWNREGVERMVPRKLGVVHSPFICLTRPGWGL